MARTEHLLVNDDCGGGLLQGFLVVPHAKKHIGVSPTRACCALVASSNPLFADSNDLFQHGLRVFMKLRTLACGDQSRSAYWRDELMAALAVLLELARALSTTPARRPIRLIAFDLEESDRAGSRAYAEDLRRRGDPLALMISLEMLGYRDPRPGSQRYPTGLWYFYPGTGDFIGLIGNVRALPHLWRLAGEVRKAVPCEFLPVPFKGRIVPDTRRSDHASFWDLGYPAIMVTDTANMRNPHYHSPSDRIETLDLGFLTAVCGGLTSGLAAL